MIRLPSSLVQRERGPKLMVQRERGPKLNTFFHDCSSIIVRIQELVSFHEKSCSLTVFANTVVNLLLSVIVTKTVL